MKDTMVSHNGITHKSGDQCATCEVVQEEYAAALLKVSNDNYDWIMNRILAEHKKHEKWAGDDWARIAAAKIYSTINEKLWGGERT